jgi:WD40 repeat protein
MVFKQFHWLEVAEFLTLGIAVVCLFVAIATEIILLPVGFLTLALIFNALNRIRGQYVSRQRLSNAVKQLKRQISQEIQQITPPEPLSPPPAPVQPPTPPKETDSRGMAQLKEKVFIIEQSLNSVIQYLNTQVLPERIEQLEKSSAQLSQTLRELTREIEQPPIPQPEPSAVVSAPVLNINAISTATKLPIVSATSEVSPSPSIPEWDVLYTLTDHTDAVASLAISPDGQWLASASWDQSLRMWDLSTGSPKANVIAHSQGLLTVVFLPSQEDTSNYQIATGSFDQTIKLWFGEISESEEMTLNLQQTLTNHIGSVHGLALSREPLLLISGSYDQTVKQWLLPDGEMHCSSYDPLGAVYAIAVDAPQGLIASAGGDGRVTLWQLDTGEQIGFLAGNVSSVESLAISADGQTLAAGCVDGSIKVWQLDPTRFGAGRPLQPVRVLNAHSGQVKALLFSQEEQILFSGGADGYLKIWHPSRREAIASLTMGDTEQTRQPGILSLAFREDHQLLIAGSADGMIKIWRRL